MGLREKISGHKSRNGGEIKLQVRAVNVGGAVGKYLSKNRAYPRALLFLPPRFSLRK